MGLQIRIPGTFKEEISISQDIAREILIDDSVVVDDYNWFVVNKKAAILGLADVIEEHDDYVLLGYLIKV